MRLKGQVFWFTNCDGSRYYERKHRQELKESSLQHKMYLLTGC